MDKLDGALCSLVELKMSLLTAGGLGWMTSKGPFQPKAFYHSMASLWNCKTMTSPTPNHLMGNELTPLEIMQLSCFI